MGLFKIIESHCSRSSFNIFLEEVFEGLLLVLLLLVLLFFGGCECVPLVKESA